MQNSIVKIPEPFNEQIREYLPESLERELLKAELEHQMSHPLEIPLIINGKPVITKETGQVVCPHDHGHVLATYSKASDEAVHQAMESALNAKKEWEGMGYLDRAAIFLKAAELISQKYRYILNAATMLNQSKNAFQAEIDSTCELADFFRYNVKFMEQLYAQQPESEKGIWNRLEYRALEGFIFALTPFNFTAIAGNLVTAPAMMGNTIVWKPASTAILSGYYLMRLFKEAGLPDGVINFIPGKGSAIGKIVLENENLAGVHFTGSTNVFSQLWRRIGENIKIYKSYPRLVGETGGKDYIFMHHTADVDQVAAAAVRGAFEYQGQKCSACSRMYVPRSKFEAVQDKLLASVKGIKTGTVLDFKNFQNAVIDAASFDTIMGYIERAKASDNAEVIAGGGSDKSKGYFIEPTIIITCDPFYESMTNEIFGPVLTLFVYEDDDFEKTLGIVDQTSVYALTGAVFANDRKIIDLAMEKLTHSAGNFYINDKPTGAVVGRQPFGGARASGTNDKAGSILNLIRWTSPRTIKENFYPPHDYDYPFMSKSKI
ncbi:MAG: L-glutamate gamma-semialdehyde dehydrogenase [Desulfobacteraceae bacterium]|nr:L-glutamate gamma-semialdehyde dehydrogenase [Desulfobacteraceae bacterium]